MTLTVVCAWCNVVIVYGDHPADVSHGICPECEVKWVLMPTHRLVKKEASDA